MCHTRVGKVTESVLEENFPQLKDGSSDHQTPLAYAFAFCTHVQQLGAAPIKCWQKAISSLPTHVPVMAENKEEARTQPHIHIGSCT